MTHAPQYVARWRDEWPERYRAGATLEQIADDPQGGFVGTVAPECVRRVLRLAGTVMRKPGNNTDWHAKVEPLWRQGLSCAVIAERLGKHRVTIHKLVRQIQSREPQA